MLITAFFHTGTALLSVMHSRARFTLTSACEGLTPPIYVQVCYQNPLSGALSSEKSVGGEQGQC